MSAGLEAITVQEWIVTKLSTDTELATMAGDADTLMDRLWDGEYQGTEDQAPWWISYTCQDNVDVKGVGAIQIMGRVRFSVKVVARGKSYMPALPVYQRVHQLLESQINQETTDGTMMASERMTSFQFPERTDGMEYRHVGGAYESLAQ